MTQQEAFTKSVVGLRSQGYQQARLPYQGCAYRDFKNKRRCAIGHLITDQEAHILEGRGAILGSLPKFDGQIKSLDGLDVKFLYALQNIHDWALTPKQMEEDLRGFAKTWNLEFPT